MTSQRVLALNCGSSSVKLALLDPDSGRRTITALAERVGTDGTTVTVSREGATTTATVEDGTHGGVVAHLLDGLTDEDRARLLGVGHRVVHGGARFRESVVVDDDVLAGIEDVADLAPLQVPANLAGIRAALAALPGVPNVAVFDTAFHATLPEVAFRYAVPTDWYADLGVRRYGFHGISHRYVTARAAQMLGRPLDRLRVVSLHLGNGCSGAAVRDGVCVDTTMGLTPLEGLVMGTRSGDLDPGVLAYVGPRLGLDVEQLVDRLNHASGLLGLSGGRSHDMRTLADAAAAGDHDAQLAIDVFCYRAAKAVAALTVPLGGLDVLVLTGGIGEHAAVVRAGILDLLSGLGLATDAPANARDGRGTHGRVSTGDHPLALVVPTDEELLIGRDTKALATRR